MNILFFDSHGGIIPSVAQDLHRENIDVIVQEALKSANVVLQVNWVKNTVVMLGLLTPHVVNIKDERIATG